MTDLLTKPKGSKFAEEIGSPGSLSRGNVIIYVWRQRDATVVFEYLTAATVQGGIVVYHGGMDPNSRRVAQSKVS